MIVVAVTYKMKVGKREEALRAARICSEKTRSEEGNLDYTFYTGIDDEDTFFLFERWESRNALAAHLKSGHLAAFRAALKELQERPSAIRVFEAEETKL
jgi:quinol monooxygenase YgiN